jgi:hypothetical protein
MRARGLLRHFVEVFVPRLARGFAQWRGRGRLRLRLLRAFGVTATVATLVTVALATHGREPGRGSVQAGPTLHVGVGQDQSIPGYVSSSNRELAQLVEQGPAEVYALVSLRAYLAPDRLTPVLGGVAVAEVYARVPLHQAQTQIVRIPAYRIPDDVVTGMRQVAARKEADADEFLRLAAKLSEVNVAEDKLRTSYLDGATLASAEATAYRDGCTCVYAAVVRASAVALEQIAARPEVRAVDPAPEVLRLDQAVFLAPLPEQADTVEPSPSAVASPTPSIISPSSEPLPEPPISPSAVTPSPTPSRSIEPLR